MENVDCQRKRFFSQFNLSVDRLKTFEESLIEREKKLFGEGEQLEKAKKGLEERSRELEHYESKLEERKALLE